MLNDPQRAALQRREPREIAVNHTLGRSDFRAEPRVLRRGLLDGGHAELPITSEHAVGLDALPPLHEDPFDRMLVAQASAEGVTLLTGDAQLARYPGPVRKSRRGAVES